MNSGPKYGQILSRYGVAPKKRLGQHFMIDPALLQVVARLMIPSEGQWAALEIGAGIGTLTRELAARAGWVYAIEMDRDLAPAVAKTCAGIANLTWIWTDALDYDLSGSALSQERPDASLVLCGNLPYYLTSDILYNVLVERTRWSRISFVVQEEVGERMAGPPGTRDFGRLSLWCQYRSRVSIERRISRGSFVPRPNVGSCLVALEVKPSFPLSVEEERVLDVVSRAAFSKRRKTLLNGLRDIAVDRDALSSALTQSGIDPEERPEDLGVDGFVRLAKAVQPVIREA
jgi:16S rRNA (adenine1518-N6/adenine1519-N6)-dimethyltransferase